MQKRTYILALMILGTVAFIRINASQADTGYRTYALPQITIPASPPKDFVLHFESSRWEDRFDESEGIEKLGIVVAAEIDPETQSLVVDDKKLADSDKRKNLELFLPLKKTGKNSWQIICINNQGNVSRFDYSIEVPEFTYNTDPLPMIWKPELRVQTLGGYLDGVESNSLATSRTQVPRVPQLSADFRIGPQHTHHTRGILLGAQLDWFYIPPTVTPSGGRMNYSGLLFSPWLRTGWRNLMSFASTQTYFTPYFTLGREMTTITGFGRMNVLSEPNPTFAPLNVWSYWLGLEMECRQYLLQREWIFKAGFYRSLVAGATLAEIGTQYTLGGYGLQAQVSADVWRKLFVTVLFDWRTLNSDSVNISLWGISVGAGYTFLR